jgi:hypothetical protein
MARRTQRRSIRSTIRLLALLALVAPRLSWGEPAVTSQDDGYRGIWYAVGNLGGQYVYKYSGGLGTYCAKHKPFAVYCEEVNKTFFCYGGTPKTSNTRLLHMVSYYDHNTGQVPRPTILLDKRTSDAHDNPVISVDDEGYIWILSTAHGTSRPAYIHKSTEPYVIDSFERIAATKDGGEPMNNFSYMQAWHVPPVGFVCFFTHYGDPVARTSFFMTSPDGVEWRWTRLAAIDQGHYQISAVSGAKAASAFNYHPDGQGLDHRTNLYYMESFGTPEFGRTWQAADGTLLTIPLTNPDNPALVHDYQSEGLKVYLKDIRLDQGGKPTILFVTSRGWESGPKNDPRTWRVARWMGRNWDIRTVTASDNNYDMGSLYLEDDATWRIIGPTETGPQAYNTGGEMAMWLSRDAGRNWTKVRTLTRDSERNQTYARRPVNAHPDFYALWADGHGRKTSGSDLYFCDRKGNVWRLPREMKDNVARPEAVYGRDPDLNGDGVLDARDFAVLGKNWLKTRLWP